MYQRFRKESVFQSSCRVYTVVKHFTDDCLFRLRKGRTVPVPTSGVSYISCDIKIRDCTAAVNVYRSLHFHDVWEQAKVGNGRGTEIFLRETLDFFKFRLSSAIYCMCMCAPAARAQARRRRCCLPFSI